MGQREGGTNRGRTKQREGGTDGRTDRGTNRVRDRHREEQTEGRTNKGREEQIEGGTDRGRDRQTRTKRYLGFHGSVHGRGLGGAAIGEGFRGAGRQRGLLGRRGRLRRTLNVLTVPLVSLGGGHRAEKG